MRTVRGRPFRKGPDPRRKDPREAGKQGGRKPLEYRKWLESIEPTAQRNLEDLLDTEDPALRLRVSQDVLDRLHGKAEQPIDSRISNLGDLIALASQAPPDEVEE